MAKEYDPVIGSVQPTDCFIYKRRETTSGNYTYVGHAIPGTATSLAAWRIVRLDNTNGSVDHANGATNGFNSVWDNATSLSYS